MLQVSIFSDEIYEQILFDVLTFTSFKSEGPQLRS